MVLTMHYFTDAVNMHYVKFLYINIFSADDGFNSTEFREFIEDYIGLAMLGYPEAAIEGVTKAVLFKYTPWPHINNRTANRDRIIRVTRKDLKK